jgi:hypothetical protein
MFEILPNPSLDVVLIALRGLLLIGALCVFALAFNRWRRADEASTVRLHQQLDRAFNEIRSLHETIVVMSARLEALNERVEVDARLAPAGTTAAQRGYDMAVRLAKNGADAEELIANCGITRHEAELLVRLHGAARTANQMPVRGPAAREPAQPQAPAWAPSSFQEPPQQEPLRTAQRRRGSLLSVVG